MADPARKRATYADLCAVPPHLVAEIIGGELRVHARPAPRHINAASVLGSRLGRTFRDGDDGPGGWWILDEPELHLIGGEEILVPDLAGWRVSTMPELPDKAYFETAPDWICEVLSPSTEAEDRSEKMPIYAAAGVSHAWLLNPVLQTLEVYRRESQRWLLLATHRGDALIRAEPFDAVELDFGALFRPPTVR
ncbi:Uma2 family endonuclease [Polyangium aurulentum]|uniref:Uma2 family endonuclease n=1 Tax=Polyangium aurulentum TaxID=2567896 RepID=UPI0010ADD849|nr:Uma2 family endonuclease [Polyangium aurulentum]UQA61664.1 Uma2 family endonuclease [Polyangium aurulentum]